MEVRMQKSRIWLTSTLSAICLVGCGHTEEEMRAKQREIDKLAADLRAAKTQIERDQVRFAEASKSIQETNEKLKAAGLGLEIAKKDAANLSQALADYKQRAEQLAIIEARFRELRSKLDKLTSIGVSVVPRNNRLVIQLPGDILFDSGKDDLKPQGKDVLSQIAEIVRNDKDLSSRYFLVAGHTDNVKYPPGGPFRDNWGLSLARARQVLLFLVGENKPADAKGTKGVTGGGLSAARWAAAGYGETDPVAGAVAAPQSPEDSKRNRRVELIVQPNVEEMLNLNAIR